MADKILVTGASGLVGKALIRSLVADGCEIYALTSSPRNVPLELINKKGVKFGFVDFEKPVDLRKLPFKIDSVIHLSGVFYERMQIPRYFLVNTLSTLHLLEYAKRAQAQRFVLASTGAVYGYEEGPLTEESPLHPYDFLTLSKHQAEMLLPQYASYFSTAVLRLFFPYGPGQKTGMIATLIKKVDTYEPVTVYNTDNPKFNPIYIDDVIEVMRGVIKVGGKQVLNVAGEEVVSVVELVERVGELLKKEPKIVTEVNPAIKNQIGDTARMKSVLGFVPRVNLATGLKKTLGL